MRIAVVLIVALLMGGCGGCQTPSQGYIYALACDALADADGVPSDAKPLPIEQARVGVAKNAASVDVPYEFRDSSGQVRRAYHTVWFKRVARTWTVERMNATPDYTNE